MLLRSLLLSLTGLTLLAQAPEIADARALVNSGVQFFKTGYYAEAVQMFERAVTMDPEYLTARLYLATALMTQYVPGSTTAENLAIADRAQQEFDNVLARDPKNLVALQSLASLAYNRAQGGNDSAEKMHWLTQAERRYLRLIEAHPSNKEGYYSLGVIAWARAYPEYQRTKQESGMRPEDRGPISNTNLRLELRNRWGQTVETGIEHLNKALSLDPNYDDALAYMNLMYRIRADMADTSEEFRQNIAKADELVAKALDIKRAKGGAGGMSSMGAPPPPPPPNAQNVAGRINVGAAAMAGKLLDAPEPMYPERAREARIQGIVRLNIIVAKDGSVQAATLVSGHPILVPAAVDAVRGYRYRPTLLNGQPVEVATQVDVNFRL